MLLLKWICWIHYLWRFSCCETFFWTVCFTPIILLVFFKQVKYFRSHVILIIKLLVICLPFKCSSDCWAFAYLRQTLSIACHLIFIFHWRASFVWLVSRWLRILFVLTFIQLIFYIYCNTLYSRFILNTILHTINLKAVWWVQ